MLCFKVQFQIAHSHAVEPVNILDALNWEMC